jgi:hypothetical protein
VPRGDKRFIRRDAKGRITESDDVSRSLSQDRRRKAKATARAGQGDRGDRKGVKASHGKRQVPAGNAILDLFGKGRLPEDVKYAENFLSVFGRAGAAGTHRQPSIQGIRVSRLH